jgi:hypothetical protein
MNILIVFVLYLLLPEFVGYGVARVLLSVLSHGRIVIQLLTSFDVIGFNSLGIRRDRQGRVEISSDVAIFLGFAAFLILLVISGLLIHAFSQYF